MTEACFYELDGRIDLIGLMNGIRHIVLHSDPPPPTRILIVLCEYIRDIYTCIFTPSGRQSSATQSVEAT